MDELDRSIERLSRTASMISGQSKSPQQVTDGFILLIEAMADVVLAERDSIRELQMRLDRHGL